MQLFAIALLSQLSAPPTDPCVQLDVAYEQLELMDNLEGEVAKKRSRKLLSLSTQCRGSDGGQRKSLEGYAFAFSILQTGDSLPSDYCAALKYAGELAKKLTKSAPKNGRIAKIRARLTMLAANSTCDKENIGGTGTPVASGKSTIDGRPADKGANEGLSLDDTGEGSASADTTPGDEHPKAEGPKIAGDSKQQPEEPRERAGQPGKLHRLKRGVIAMGVVTGASLAASAMMSGLANEEYLKVIQALKDDNPPLTKRNPCKLGNVEQGAESYCGKLNNLKVATIVSWSLTGASALTTVALGIIYAKKRMRQRTVALAPKLQLGRHGVIWGVGGRF